MGVYYYGFDSTYIMYVIPAIIITLIASIKVKTTFSKYSMVNSIMNITAADAAQRVLYANGVTGVRIERVSGNLTDHYDPRANVIRLSDSVYNSKSVAAIGVAAHEAGHAVQYAQNYAPIKLRASIINITNIGSTLSWPIFLIGLLFSIPALTTVGIILYSLMVVFQLLTLPVEFNASSRALSTLRNTGILCEGKEINSARKVLTAAAMTYVAALFASIMNLFRLIALSNRNNRR